MTEKTNEKHQPQLHEVLAVDRELEKKDQDDRAEAINLFLKRPELFQGSIKTLQMLDDKDKYDEEAQAESVQIYFMVDDIIDKALESTIRYMNALMQKECTNQHAKADVILDNGDVLIENVPATALLAMEKILAAVAKLYDAIPVLAAGIKWDEDTNLGKHVYKAKPDIVRLRTKNIQKPIELAEATDRHPAQVQLVPDTITVGKYTEQRWSAMMLPRRKQILMERLDEIQRAVKKARMRANTANVVTVSNFGKKVFDWINR